MRILITESRDYNSRALDLYREQGELLTLDGNFEDIVSHLPDVDIIVIRLRHQIDSDFLDAAGKLKYIVTPTTGLTHIDLSYARENSVQVLSLKDEAKFLNTVTATAELTWSLLLNLTRNTIPATQHVNQGKWDRDEFRGIELSGKTIGVVGYGRLGRQLAHYASAFGMKILAHDPYVSDFETSVNEVSLDYLLSQSDIVSVHVALTSETELMFREEQFSKMKSGAIFINTSRGEVLCETAFVDARRAGIISAAGFDVLSVERGIDGNWLAKSPIAQLAIKDPQILITPHIGGCTLDSMHKTELHMAQKLTAFLKAVQPS